MNYKVILNIPTNTLYETYIATKPREKYTVNLYRICMTLKVKQREINSGKNRRKRKKPTERCPFPLLTEENRKLNRS